MKQLGYTDSIFITLETPQAPQHIAFLGVYDPSTAPGGIVRFKDVLANIERRLNLLPTFRTRVVQVPGRLDRPYWVEDDSFDVEYHIRHTSLPQPGDWRQLCIQVSRLQSRQLDMKRPLWECNVIEGLNNVEGCPPGCFAVHIKLHHSLVDGDLGQRVMGIIHDLEPDPLPFESEEDDSNFEEEYKPPMMGDGELVAKAFTNRVRNIPNYIKTFKGLAESLADSVGKIAREEMPPPPMGPKTRFDEPVGLHRVIDAADFSLSEMKEIKDAAQVTINDVCVTVCGGAMRKYLIHYGELPAESIVANTPVNMRKRGSSSEDNNQIASLMTQIHTNVADPVDRLHKVHESMVGAKKHIGSPLAEPLKMVALFPPFMSKPISRLYAHAGLSKYLPAGTPTVITNVPGPQFDLYMNGAKMIKFYGLGMLTPGVGLFHTIFSMGDNISITVLASRDQMPDPAFYRQCLEESYAELKDAVLGGGKKAG